MCVDVQRFWVLSPSVSRMMTLSRSGDGAGALNGATGDSVCQAICMPIVTLVLPVGVIASILAVERGPVGGQRHHRGRAGRRLMGAVLGRGAVAGRRVA